MSGRLICAFGLPARAKGSASLHRPEWLREEGCKVEGAGGGGGVASAHYRPHIQSCGVHVGTALRLFPHSSQRIT